MSLSNMINKLDKIVFKYFKLCLKIKKPHYSIDSIEDKYSEAYDMRDYEEELCKQHDQQNKIDQVKIFDREQNINKILIVFRTDCLLKYELQIFKNIFNNFARDDLILNLYDQYFLDPEHTFYVFEIQCYEYISFQLFFYDNISLDLINKIKDKQQSYIFKLLGLDSQDQMLNGFYCATLLSEKEIEIKYNIFDFYDEIYSQVIEKLDQQMNIMSMEEEQEEDEQEVIQEEQEQEEMQEEQEEEDNNNKIGQLQDKNFFRKLDEQQLRQYEQNVCEPLKKQNLLENIKLICPNRLKTHNLNIFEVIQQHHQYDNFELIQINKNSFEFQLNKLNKKILLKGIKFNDINDALQTENEYQKLYQLSGKLKSNLVYTSTIILDNCSYLLLEFNNNNNSDDTEKLQTLVQIIVKSLLEYDEYEEIYSHQIKIFDFVQNITEISYELYLKYKIKLTNIDPNKIFVKQNMEQGNYSFLIERDCFKKSTSEYIKLISNCFKKLQKICAFKHRLSIISYLETIQNDSIENTQKIQKQYQNFAKMNELLQYVIQYNQNKAPEFVTICQDNPFMLQVNFENQEFYQSKDKMKLLKKNISFLIQNQERIAGLRLITNYKYSQLLEEKDLQKKQDNIALEQTSLSFDQALLEEIGFSNILGYNSYNIGLSVCQFLQNLSTLYLVFSEEFNFKVVEQDSNFLKLGNQILCLTLNFQSKNENLIILIQQLQQYINLNTLQIQICSFFGQKQKLKNTIMKTHRLVKIRICQEYHSYQISKKIDEKLGFLF
ncbi:hypothetical protein ABPG74_010249 [Tetrahymena malaccensis]